MGYRVMCNDDNGKVILTGRHYSTLERAQDYAATISPSRNPRVLRELACLKSPDGTHYRDNQDLCHYCGQPCEW